ncbi:Hypothetical protein D9617_9g025990 [Elsinoe fawcettii]|nr:Hypothetical protein D9617_9g025990 [Elsinoe fawcettii]
MKYQIIFASLLPTALGQLQAPAANAIRTKDDWIAAVTSRTKFGGCTTYYQEGLVPTSISITETRTATVGTDTVYPLWTVPTTITTNAYSRTISVTTSVATVTVRSTLAECRANYKKRHILATQAAPLEAREALLTPEPASLEPMPAENIERRGLVAGGVVFPSAAGLYGASDKAMLSKLSSIPAGYITKCSDVLEIQKGKVTVSASVGAQTTMATTTTLVGIKTDTITVGPNTTTVSVCPGSGCLATTVMEKFKLGPPKWRCI